MISCEKEKFTYFFFLLLTKWYEFPAPKLTNLYIFIIPIPLNMHLLSKNPYLTAHI